MTRFGTSPTQLRELFPLRVYNTDSEEAPALAAMEITGVSLDSYSDPVYSVQKPTGTAGKLIIFNGPQPIASERYGWGAEASTTALISSSPAINTTVGPVNDSWELTASGTGYKTRSTVQDGIADVVQESDGENYRLIRASVKEPGGVTPGGSFTVDGITALAGGLDPSGGNPATELEIDGATAAHVDNTEIVAIYDPASTNDWKEFAAGSAPTPQTYNVKLQAAKAYADGSVSVRLLEDDLTTESGSAFLAYDPHNQFSTGRVTDQTGRIALVTDPDTGAERWELTHVEGLALWIHGTLASDESSGTATATGYTARGVGWNKQTPTGTITINGVPAGALTGDTFTAYVDDGEANPYEYRWTSGNSKRERMIVGQLKAGSGVAIGTATFVIDNVRPLAGGVDPVDGNAATEVTINDAIGGYVDNQEIRAVWDDAENSGAGGWKDATIHRFTRIRGLVNEMSGVAQGAGGWAVDGIELLAGTADPGATVDGYAAKKAYDDNDEVELIWNDETVRWEDCTDLNEAGEPQTYNVKLQAAKTKAATSVSVKFLEDDLTTENGSAFTAYDPPAQFSSGKVTDAIGRVTRVTDPDTGSDRFELTHLRELAEYVRGTLSTDESGGTATDTGGYTAWGGSWKNTSPTGTITITGLDGQRAGDGYVAVLEDADSTPQKYRAVEYPREGVVDIVSIIVYVPARSGLAAGTAASTGKIYAMCNAANVGQSGVFINGREYDFTSATLGQMIEPDTPVTVRLFNHSESRVEPPASGYLFCTARRIGFGGAEQEYEIISPLELRTLKNYDSGEFQQITHTSGDPEWSGLPDDPDGTCSGVYTFVTNVECVSDEIVVTTLDVCIENGKITPDT